MWHVVKVSFAAVLLASLAFQNPAAASTIKTQHTYVIQAQKQIDALSAKITAAEAKVKQLDKEAQAACETDLKALRKKERLARVRLEEIRKAEQSEWQSLRKKEDVLLVSLQKSYTHLKNQYFP